MTNKIDEHMDKLNPFLKFIIWSILYWIWAFILTIFIITCLVYVEFDISYYWKIYFNSDFWFWFRFLGLLFYFFFLNWLFNDTEIKE